jgi:hypothetical protein
VHDLGQAVFATEDFDDKDRFFLATHAEALRQLLGHEE